MIPAGSAGMGLSVLSGRNLAVSGEDERRGGGAGPEQLALIRETVRRAKVPKAKPRTWRGAALAKELPIARVVVNKGVLHLDQFFDYAVPEELDADAQPGVRVRVRFGAGARNVRGGRREGGGLIDGFLVERRAETDYTGPLAALAGVVSPERVLSPGTLSLARAVADRYAGSLADVLQLAVPPRNARAEAETVARPCPAARRAGGRDLGAVSAGARVPERAGERSGAPRGVDGAARARTGRTRSRGPSPPRSPRAEAHSSSYRTAGARAVSTRR